MDREGELSLLEAFGVGRELSVAETETAAVGSAGSAKAAASTQGCQSFSVVVAAAVGTF